ncbi:MAG: hypothetical protein ACKO37_03235 [Vampirovibrionales bacterium]
MSPTLEDRVSALEQKVKALQTQVNTLPTQEEFVLSKLVMTSSIDDSLKAFKKQLKKQLKESRELLIQFAMGILVAFGLVLAGATLSFQTWSIDTAVVAKLAEFKLELAHKLEEAMKLAKTSVNIVIQSDPRPLWVLLVFIVLLIIAVVYSCFAKQADQADKNRKLIATLTQRLEVLENQS